MTIPKAKKKTKIMVFGTFDLLHEGHINFFRQAKKLARNSFLVVSVARDRNVLRIKKSLPWFTEVQRKALVAGCPPVDKVVLGGVEDYLPHIVKERPDIIALGYDQSEYVKTLANDLKTAGLSVKICRLRPYKNHLYKSSRFKELMLKA